VPSPALNHLLCFDSVKDLLEKEARALPPMAFCFFLFMFRGSEYGVEEE
jgi:hypothetical protein